jgi:chorismate mutase
MAAVLQDTPASNIVTLDSVRGELIRLEETIIFALIERSQFAVNPEIYATDEKSLLKQTANENNHSESFLDFFLEKTEQLHASLGRYTSPDEHPFLIDGLTVPLIQAQNYPASLRPNNININERIKTIYEQKILPRICLKKGSDGQYGSSATMDINVLQAISKRIHFGKFVAEAKFLREKEKFSNLVSLFFVCFGREPSSTYPTEL